MKIKIARNAGFCMGVKRAVDMAIDISRQHPETVFYTYGHLVHNPQTVALLAKMGIVPITNIHEIPANKQNISLIIRAHGITPVERAEIKKRNIHIVDATCPKVAFVQGVVRKHARQGYNIVIFGNILHPEVNAILGYAEGKGFVINSQQEMTQLPQMEQVCVVAQTTSSVDEYKAIGDALRARFNKIVIFNTICDSTEQRQKETKKIAQETDAVIVVGGKNSANTARLAQIAKEEGTDTYHVETVADLMELSLTQYACIGIVAGASTPNWILDKVVTHIRKVANQKKYIWGSFKTLLNFLIRTDIFSASGAIVFCLLSARLQGINVQPFGIIATVLFLFAAHTISRIANRRSNAIIGSIREDTYAGREKTFLIFGIASLATALLIATQLGIFPFALLTIWIICGVTYHVFYYKRQVGDRDVAGFKNVAVALAWATIITCIPCNSGLAVMGNKMALISGGFIFGLVFVRSLLSDISDIQSDRLIGKTTIPILIGSKKTGFLIVTLCALVLLVLLLAGFPKHLWMGLALPYFYLWICFVFYDRWQRRFSRIAMEGIIETSYLIAGLVVIWYAFKNG
ncbi:MAG: 4-hydroxy-3-methylbut-2-enyl diphosphate reductase [Deltaproteobacteria bacterium]